MYMINLHYDHTGIQLHTSLTKMELIPVSPS